MDEAERWTEDIAFAAASPATDSDVSARHPEGRQDRRSSKGDQRGNPSTSRLVNRDVQVKNRADRQGPPCFLHWRDSNRSDESDQALRLGPDLFLLATDGRRWRVARRQPLGRSCRLAERLTNLAVRVGDVLLEFANALPNRCPDLRYAPGAKQHQHD